MAVSLENAMSFGDAVKKMTAGQRGAPAPEARRPETPAAQAETVQQEEPEALEVQTSQAQGEAVDADLDPGESQALEPGGDLAVSEEPDGSEDTEDTWSLTDLAEALEMDEDSLRSATKVRIKVDGKESDVTLGELVKGYQLEAHTTNKSKALAEQRRAFEAEAIQQRQRFEQQAQALATQFQTAEQLLQEAWNAPDLRELEQDDPGEAALQRQKIQERFARLEYARAEARQRYEAETHRQFLEHLGRQSQMLQERYPDWEGQYRDRVQGVLNELQVRRDETHLWGDARVLGVLTELIQLREQVAKGTAVKGKANELRKRLQAKQVPAKLLKASKERGASAQRKTELDKLQKSFERATGTRAQLSAAARLMSARRKLKK